MSTFDNLRDEAEKAAREHPDAVEKVSDEAIQRGGQEADKVTGDRYDGEVRKAEQAADQHIGE